MDCVGNGRDNRRLAIQWVRCGSHQEAVVASATAGRR